VSLLRGAFDLEDALRRAVVPDLPLDVVQHRLVAKKVVAGVPRFRTLPDVGASFPTPETRPRHFNGAADYAALAEEVLRRGAVKRTA